MKTLRVAVVGLGRIGFTTHLKEVNKHPGYELISCMDKSIERLNEAKELYGIKCYTDYNIMIDASDLDLVIIASPTNFHYEQTKYAFINGVDVFLEKPMTSNLIEAKGLYELSLKFKRKLTVNQPHRSMAITQGLLDVLKSNLIGDIYKVKYNNAGYRVRNDWQALKKHGGGMLYNYGAHFIDLFLYIFGGNIKNLYCHTDKILSAGDAEDVVKIILDTKEGILFDLDINQANNIQELTWAIYGKHGSITIDSEYINVKYLKDISPLNLEMQKTLSAKGRSYDRTGKLEWIEKKLKLSDYKSLSYFDSLYDYMALNKKPLVPIEETINVMEVLKQCEDFLEG